MLLLWKRTSLVTIMQSPETRTSIEILVDNKPVSEYSHKGLIFIEGREGTDFTIRLSNSRNSRVLAIPSVDGLSVLDGKPASHDSRGYIISPRSSITIPGWTLDQSSVAKFFFTQKEDSYSSRTSAGTQTGVVGVMLYDELGSEALPDYGVARHYSGNFDGIYDGINSLPLMRNGIDKGIAGAPFSINQMSASASASNSAFGLGTGFGEKSNFATNNVQFNKGKFLTGLTIYYDNKRNLEKRGIKFPVMSTRYTGLPQAFPGTGCTPPPGWTG